MKSLNKIMAEIKEGASFKVLDALYLDFGYDYENILKDRIKPLKKSNNEDELKYLIDQLYFYDNIIEEFLISDNKVININTLKLEDYLMDGAVWIDDEGVDVKIYKSKNIKEDHIVINYKKYNPFIISFFNVKKFLNDLRN